jgi:hypothetical protein
VLSRYFLERACHSSEAWLTLEEALKVAPIVANAGLYMLLLLVDLGIAVWQTDDAIRFSF